MNCLRDVAVIGTMLFAAAAGCGDNQPPTSGPTGRIQLAVQSTPGDLAAIHVAVTGPDFVGSVEADLVKQPDESWLGTVLDVPPGTGRTVIAEGFDADHNNTYEGIETNVTVFPGKLIDIALSLKPTGNGTPTNTAPHFVTLLYPDAILSSETAMLFATAVDPDANTQLTYTWSVLQGGGTLSVETVANQTPSNAVTTVYTPASGFTGVALIQVAVSDGLATTTTSFPISVGAGLVPVISFDVLPDLTITSIDQSLMPRGTSQIHFTVTNPTQPWTPATMHVHTSWADSCGGTFDAASEDIDITRGTAASRTVTYTASSTQVTSLTSCHLTLTLSDAADAQMTFPMNVWIAPPMAMFVSSAVVSGSAFHGQWELADQFCQQLADDSVGAPPGLYHALLSFDEIGAKDRLLDAPYVRVDGTPIARSKAELFSIDLLNAVRTNENNADSGATMVFTGTASDGTKGENCLDWTSASSGESATIGDGTAAASPDWTNSAASACDAQLPIYCVQQPDQLPR